MNYNTTRLANYLAGIVSYKPSIPYSRMDFSMILKEYLNKNIVRKLNDFYEDDEEFYKQSFRKLQNKNQLDEFIEKLDLGEDKTFFLDKKKEDKGIINASNVSLGTKDEKIISDIEELIKKYDKLLSNEETTESDWQNFFKEHPVILSTIFERSQLFFGDEENMGGKDIHNQNGNKIDFLFKSSKIDNLALIEIKKSNDSLIRGKKAYRGDDVFDLSKNLIGGINQLNAYRDSLQKQYCFFADKTEDNFEVFEPKTILIIGELSELSTEKKKCFELFRKGLKNIKIFTYDEIYDKLQSFKLKKID